MFPRGGRAARAHAFQLYREAEKKWRQTPASVRQPRQTPLTRQTPGPGIRCRHLHAQGRADPNPPARSPYGPSAERSRTPVKKSQVGVR